MEKQSKKYHEMRIRELQFQRDVKKNQDNRTHTTQIAALSLAAIFFIFEFERPDKSLFWLGVLVLVFATLMWVINKEKKYPEDQKIQKHYDALVGRR